MYVHVYVCVYIYIFNLFNKNLLSICHVLCVRPQSRWLAVPILEGCCEAEINEKWNAWGGLGRLINTHFIITINNAMLPKPYCAWRSSGKLRTSADFWVTQKFQFRRSGGNPGICICTNYHRWLCSQWSQTTLRKRAPKIKGTWNLSPGPVRLQGLSSEGSWRWVSRSWGGPAVNFVKDQEPRREESPSRLACPLIALQKSLPGLNSSSQGWKGRQVQRGDTSCLKNWPRSSQTHAHMLVCKASGILSSWSMVWSPHNPVVKKRDWSTWVAVS